MTRTETERYAATRRSLHAVAELVLAGPQYARAGDIRLRVGADGIETWTEPRVRVAGSDLVHDGGRTPLAGRTCAELAADVGVTARHLDDVYPDVVPVAPDEPLDVHPEDAARLLSALALGDAALERFAPGQERVLWPEHFDVAITWDEVNYGVSPGDAFLAEPYAYVGPHEVPTGSFWNAPFGAVRPIREVADAADLVTFLEEGRSRSS
ncbi:MAG: hypothetical protein ACXVXC_11120 [Nocardioidaceae bacterium]